MSNPPNIAEGRIWRPIETSTQKHSVVSATSEFLIEKGAGQEFLKNVPNLVLTPPADSKHWLQGVVLLGNTDISKATTYQHVFERMTDITFQTPEDNATDHKIHHISFTDDTPIVTGSEILVTEGNARNLHAGIRDVKNNGTEMGGDRSNLLVPDKLREGVRVGESYYPTAILINIEEQLFAQLLETHPKLVGQLGRTSLLATDLTSIK